MKRQYALSLYLLLSKSHYLSFVKCALRAASIMIRRMNKFVSVQIKLQLDEDKSTLEEKKEEATDFVVAESCVHITSVQCAWTALCSEAQNMQNHNKLVAKDREKSYKSEAAVLNILRIGCALTTVGFCVQQNTKPGIQAIRKEQQQFYTLSAWAI